MEELGLHGLGVHLPYLDAAGGDDGVRHRALFRDGHREGLENGQQRLAPLPGDVVDLLLRRDAGELDDHGDELLRQEVIQSVAEVVVEVLLEVREEALVQLGLVQGGLQVDLEAVVLLFKVPHVGGGGEDQGPADTEMGEEQLAEVLVDLFLPLVDREAHVPEAETLEPGAGDAGGDDALQGHQGAVQLRHRVAQGRRQTVAVPGGAGGGIADAAGGQDHGVGGIGLPFPPDGPDGAVRRLDVHGPVMGPADTEGLQPPLQGGADVKSPVAHREDPAASFHLQGDA